MKYRVFSIVVFLILNTVYPLLDTQTAYAAARGFVSLNPSRQVVEVGKTFPVTVQSDSNEAVNAFQIRLRFSSDILEVVAVEQTGSWATIWVTESPKFFSTDGTISFQGGTPNPGFTGKGVIGKVVFRGKAKGRANVTVADDSKLLANDGMGTNVLSEFSQARYTIVGEGEAREVTQFGWWIIGIIATLFLGGLVLKYRRR